MFLIEGYFDESGDLDEPPGVFCISGYFIASEQAKIMHAEWLAVLDKYQLGFFHMVDCAHGNEGFGHLTKAERIEVVTEMIGLIKKYTLEGFSIFAKADSYKSKMDAPDVYSDCAAGCVYAVQSFLQMNRVDGNIAYFFEQGHKDRHSAYIHVGEKIKRPSDSLTFASKRGMPLLQAADLLAWQSTKYAKDYMYARMLNQEPLRPPRKDFLSLMEHDHMFAYMGAGGDKEKMGIELWPTSKRSPTSVSMSMKDDVQLVNWIEEGTSIPVIPVEKTAGWRPGGAKFTYIGFNGFKDKPFALAFDEPRLFEALAFMLSATSNYENSTNTPLFSAESLWIEEVNGLSILRIKMLNAATLAIHLDANAVKRLKEIVAGL